MGGLGLGFTARAALEDDRVRSLTVVEALAPVIDWHERDLLPGASELTSDPRTQLRLGDFFELAAGDDGLDPGRPGDEVDVVLLDIDHTPRHVLHASHAAFYTTEGLAALAAQLRPDGVFALWSDDPPDDEFLAVVDAVFADHHAHVVAFPNFLTAGESTNTVYVARTPRR